MQLCRLHVLAVLVGSHNYFLRDAKCVSTVFLSWHWLAKIYIKWNLRKASIVYVRSYCILHIYVRSQCILHIYVRSYCILHIYVRSYCILHMYVRELLYIAYVCQGVTVYCICMSGSYCILHMYVRSYCILHMYVPTDCTYMTPYIQHTYVPIHYIHIAHIRTTPYIQHTYVRPHTYSTHMSLYITYI